MYERLDKRNNEAEYWNRMIFTDEGKFNIAGYDAIFYKRRTKSTNFKNYIL